METLKTRLPLNFLMVIASFLGIYLFMSWTVDRGLEDFVSLLYSNKKVITLSEQLNIIISTGYYFSIFVVFTCFISQAYKYILQKKSADEKGEDPQFTKTTNSALIFILHNFLIFMSLYFYLLRQDSGKLNKTYINLLPFWFLTSQVLYLIGSWLSSPALINLKVTGMIMSISIGVLIGGQIKEDKFIPMFLNL